MRDLVPDPDGTARSVDSTDPPSARRILLRGRVQGVGFRPFVHRLARQFEVHGWVRNLSGQVIIHAEGTNRTLDVFQAALLTDAPGLARPELVGSAAAVPTGLEGFFVEESDTGAAVDISVPPDVALCPGCRRELGDREDRRFGYPFLNCTQCGPRYTIIASLPYDRARTSMERFPLCPDCLAEYEEVADRRYHAEPVACPVCGPTLEWVGVPAGTLDGTEAATPTGTPVELPTGPRVGSSAGTSVQTSLGASAGTSAGTSAGDSALTAAVELLERGGILGLKGIGGYHLVCDATSDLAVGTLRARKKRPGKPLAVMVPRSGADGLEAARELATIRPLAGAALLSEVHPIVLVPRSEGAAVVEGVAPGLRELGLMLPYSPLHELLLGVFGRPLVATSGNSSGEPLVFTRADAETYLSGLVDGFLHHDRPILRSIDDSVLRDFGETLVPIRIGRGLAPLELPLPRASRLPRLALGGHMKSTVALVWGERFVLSPHLGDLERPRALDAFVQATESLRALYAVEPGELLADAHPDYASTRWGRASGLPVREVPHHRAHASALAGEHPDVERWLVFAWDGVGLGEDGTLWGGETFHGGPGRWERVGSIRPFRVVGAGRAGREPLRSAQAMAWEIGCELPDDDTGHATAALARRAWEQQLGTSTTTAVGRIFDAAAAILLGLGHYDYEAQGPMELEAVAGEMSDSESPGEAVRLPIERDVDSVWRIDWEPLLRRILDPGSPVSERAALLHATLAEAAVEMALRVHAERPFDAVGLTGGVFQNRRLTEEVWRRCAERGLAVRVAKQVPMNDGGLAYGQVIEVIASED